MPASDAGIETQHTTQVSSIQAIAIVNSAADNANFSNNAASDNADGKSVHAVKMSQLNV